MLSEQNFSVFGKQDFVNFFSPADSENGRSASEKRRLALLSTRASESDSGAKDAKSADFIGIFWSGSEERDVKIMSE